MTQQALSNYRIIDLTGVAGAFGAKLLADLGADVIKVEPRAGGETRHTPPFATGDDGNGVSLFHLYVDTNKRSATLDLDTVEGQELMRRLIVKADAVLDTYPPGYLAERGIGHAQAKALNEQLVWMSLTPFGLTGPRRDWRGSDLVAWAASGNLYTNGFPEQPPVAPGGPVMLAYAVGAAYAAAGCLMALRARRITGRGQLVDISMQEANLFSESPVNAFLDDLIPRHRFGNRRSSVVPMGTFPCKDGYVHLLIRAANHWQPLAEWIKEKTGNEAVTEALFDDPYARAESREFIEESVESLTTQYMKQELFVEAQRRGLPFTPLNTADSLLQDPHLAARSFWTTIDDPQVGTIRAAGPPYRLSLTPWQSGPAPRLGEHNHSVYRDLLGLSEAEVTALTCRGVI